MSTIETTKRIPCVSCDKNLNSMDRITINNAIVLMRHAVRKARVAVASKLIKEIKLLNGRKHGNEHVIEKCKRKANKLIKEMKKLKKLKDDDISRFAITNTKDIKEVLADSNVGIKSRIMIRLAFHKSLKAKVEEFKEKFPDYQSYFDSEPKDKKPKNKQHKTSVVEQHDRNGESIVDTTSLEVVDETIQDESCCDPAHEDRHDDSGMDSEDSRPMVSENENAQRDKKVVKHSPKNPRIVTVDVKPKESSTVKIVSKLATVKRFNVANNVMENIGTVESITNDAEPQEDIVQSDGEETDVFWTNTYVDNNNSRMTVDSTNSRSHIGKNSMNFDTSSCHVSSRDSFINAREKSNHSDKFARNRATLKNKFTSITDRPLENFKNKRLKMDNIRNTKVSQKNTHVKEDNGDLHPSWAARKKQQDILKQGFQGKKIVFNDD